MCEKTRIDGFRKPKLSAIPIVFAFSKAKLKRKAPAIRDVPLDES